MNRLAFVLTCIIIAVNMTQNAFGGEPFTSQSTGADWNSASLDYRKSYCQRMATAQQELAPGISGQFIFESLQEFYISDDPTITQQKITEIIGLTVAAYAKQ